MKKIKIEWNENSIWKSVDAKVTSTRNGNCKIIHENKTLVFKEAKAGTPVLQNIDGEWKQAGRISVDCHIFLGDGLSYYEYTMNINPKDYTSRNRVYPINSKFDSFADLEELRKSNSNSEW